jgi:hypothetical protein
MQNEHKKAGTNAGQSRAIRRLKLLIMDVPDYYGRDVEQTAK